MQSKACAEAMSGALAIEPLAVGAAVFGLLALQAGFTSVETGLMGVVLGQHVPTNGPWTRAFNALPGGLIVSLVTVMLADAGPGSVRSLRSASPLRPAACR